MTRQHRVRGVTGARSSAAVGEIPDKLRFRIGEVAQICAVPPYVLRFWESEFHELRPAKGESGQRLYRRRDVEMALRVRALLYDEGYTIAGARQMLRGSGTQLTEAPAATEMVDAGVVRALRRELQEVLRMLAVREDVGAGTQPERRRARQPAWAATGNLFEWAAVRTTEERER